MRGSSLSMFCHRDIYRLVRDLSYRLRFFYLAPLFASLDATSAIVLFHVRSSPHHSSLYVLNYYKKQRYIVQNHRSYERCCIPTRDWPRLLLFSTSSIPDFFPRPLLPGANCVLNFATRVGDVNRGRLYWLGQRWA